MAGDELDEAIVNHCKHDYNLAIGTQTAEDVKIEAGSACPLAEEVRVEIRGRDLVSGLPKTIVVGSEELREALEEPVGHIVEAVKDTLDRTPPELAGDIMDRGITLAGGGALLARTRTAPPRRVPDALSTGRVTADVRGGGLGHLPRGVRGHPSRKQAKFRN